MLIITRTPGSNFTITTPDGEEIVVTYLPHEDGKYHGGQIKLGIEAPKSFRIARDDMKKPQPTT